MKRPITVLIILIVLTMIIGFEHINRGLQFLIADRRIERETHLEVSTDKRIDDSLDASFSRHSQEIQGSHLASQSSEPPNVITDQMILGSQDPVIETVAIGVTGHLSSMHFIRSSEIVGTSEFSAAEIERLQRAIDILGDGLNPKALIFDADTLSTSDTPFVLFARDGFDLTDQARVIYNAITA